MDKQRIHEILERGGSDDKVSCYTDIFLVILISLNILAIILETVNSINTEYRNLFKYFEIFSVVIFSIEYIARVWSCVVDKKYQDPIRGRFRYMGSFYAVVDLVAILPSILAFFGLDLRILRALRIFRFLRFAKLARYSKSLQLIVRVIKVKRGELVVTLIVMFVLLMFSAALLYYFEHAVQPEVFSSIPAAMWWGG